MSPSEALEHQTGQAPVLGADLFYDISGEGYPLILLHAGIANSRMWDPQFDAFTAHYRTLRYDLRGHGQSPLTPVTYSHWQDLMELMNYLEIEQAHILGISMGARVAIDFALERPERVGALVLASAAPPGFQHGSPPAYADEAAKAFEAEDFVAAAEFEVRIWVDGPHRRPEQIDPELRDAIRDMDIRNLKYEATGVGEEVPVNPPALERLEQIVAPTLVLSGELDQPFTQAGSQELARRIPAARLVSVPGAAHLLNLEKPEVFNRKVLAFLAQN